MSLRIFTKYAEELFEQRPKFRSVVERVLSTLAARAGKLPVVHFTLQAVRLPDGTVVQTPFVNSILDSGLRPLDSNVGAFVDRRNGVKLARAGELGAVAAIAQALVLVDRYRHHGQRTNKQSLGTLRDSCTGVPVMIVADAAGAILRHGSDPDDHYVVDSGIRPEAILGVVEVARKSAYDVVVGLFTLIDAWLGHEQGGDSVEMMAA